MGAGGEGESWPPWQPEEEPGRRSGGTWGAGEVRPPQGARPLPGPGAALWEPLELAEGLCWPQPLPVPAGG